VFPIYNMKFNIGQGTGISLKLPVIISALALISLAAVPFFPIPSGLDNPEPIGPYLNGKFPAEAPSNEISYEVAFPNLTFNSPLTWANHPSQNKIFVGQRDGKIFCFENNDNTNSKDLFLDLTEKVGVVQDGGFLGMVLHPDFGTPGKPGRNYFYTYYSTRDSLGGNEPSQPTGQPCIEDATWFGGYLVLSRWEVTDGTLQVNDQVDELIMIKLRLYNSSHRGGGMVFGPDGYLYLAIGDQSQHNTAQDVTTSLDGGVIRIDVDMDPAGSHPPTRQMPQDPRGPDEISGIGYYIPNDNPFVSPQGNQFEEYFTLGHRNPHRLTHDKHTGTLYMGEIGSNRHEEVNIIEKGKNYGWPVYEGNFKKNECISDLYNNMPNQLPLLAFERSETNAIIGGHVYRGNSAPYLYGKYICADFGEGEEVWSVDNQTGEFEFLFAFAPANIISFGQDQSGELYLMKLGDNVPIYRLFQPGANSNLPTNLSETGAFDDLASLKPADGLLPYELIESFWSDGAEKFRWMAIPNDGTHNNPSEQIQFSENGEWIFPVGSVLVKHFEINTNKSNPDEIRRLETRFSIKAEDGRFYYVTYKWLEDESDAILLNTGLDEDLTITTASGTMTQTWHYPSRVECQTCHLEALGGTLGPRTRYLNKSINYPETGITANQLITLSHLGALNATISESATNQYLTAVSTTDPDATQENKVRSYLDLNCGYCHRPGTGNRSVLDLRLVTPSTETNLFSNALNDPLGINGARFIYPGDVEKSVLYHRLNSLDPAIMMPPLAKNVLDQSAIDLISDWILEMDSAVPIDDNGLKATYFDNANFSGSTVEKIVLKIDFDWGTGSPHPLIVANTFAARWEGFLQAPNTGTFTFYTDTDDGVRLWIADSLLIDQWIEQDGAEWSATFPLTGGERVPIKMEYFEQNRSAHAKLFWSGPGISKQVISEKYLFQEAEPVALELASTTIYPNPAVPNSTLQIFLKWPRSELVQVILMNANGQQIVKQQLELSTSSQQFNFELGELDQGIYFINFSGPSYRETKRLAIQ